MTNCVPNDEHYKQNIKMAPYICLLFVRIEFETSVSGLLKGLVISDIIFQFIFKLMLKRMLIKRFNKVEICLTVIDCKIELY